MRQRPDEHRLLHDVTFRREWITRADAELSHNSIELRPSSASGDVMPIGAMIVDHTAIRLCYRPRRGRKQRRIYAREN
jgi:hypothetical protein